MPLYDDDFYAWTKHQATLLRAAKWQELDYVNLAEEIESLGRSDRRQLKHRLEVLIMHLLKWQYQPERRERGQSWRSTIREQRNRIHDLLEDSPSLRPQVDTLNPQIYIQARLRALDETQLDEAVIPTVCPYTVAQVLDDAFWPDETD